MSFDPDDRPPLRDEPMSTADRRETYSRGYRNTIRAMQRAGIPLTERQKAALDTDTKETR